MKQANTVLILILSFVTAVAAVYLINPPRRGETGHITAPVSANETSYERVMRTGALRCGYAYSDGDVMKDEATGQAKGPWVDIVEAMGKALALKIEWTEQVGSNEAAAEIQSGKIDAMCSGMRVSAAKSKEIAFTAPLAYQAIETFVRSDDHRFDDNLSLLDDPGVKLAVIENEDSDSIAQQNFPKAQKDILVAPNGAGSALLTDVITGKADATFTTAGLWHEFDQSNPGKTRQLPLDKRLGVYGLALAAGNDDLRLLNMLNAAAQEIQDSGGLERILDQADLQWPEMYIKPLKPYP